MTDHVASQINAATIHRRHDALIARAESAFIFDLMSISIDGECIRPCISKSSIDEMRSTMGKDVPDFNKTLCGNSDSEFVRVDENDLKYEDEREILTIQEIKILRWSESRLDPSWKNIYIALIAMRVFLGAESNKIDAEISQKGCTSG